MAAAQSLAYFFRASHIGVAICDRHLRYRAINQALARMNGPSIKEHLGQTVDSILGESSRGVKPLLEKVLSSGSPVYGVEIRANLPRRRLPGFWIADYLPIRSERSETIGVFALVSEIPRLERPWARNARRARELSQLLRRTSELMVEVSQISGIRPRVPKLRRSSAIHNKQASVVGRLSAREREVLQLIAQGRSNKEVAVALDRSVKTVEAHRSTISHKLQARTLADLVLHAIRAGLIRA